MPKTRRRRSRRGGQWWKFWGKKTKSNPAPINMQGNAVKVEKSERSSRFDPRAYDKNADTARMMKAAMERDYQRDSKPTKMDAWANNTQSGRGRFRKRRRSRRRRSRRRRSRRRKSRRRRY